MLISEDTKKKRLVKKKWSDRDGQERQREI